MEIQVVAHRETPGLGSKITAERYLRQYKGQHPEQFDVRVEKDGGNVDAISGATISSRAVSEAIQLAYDAFKQYQDEEGAE